MRRTAGLLLVGAGAFFLALAPLIRFYVAHKLIAAPVDFYQRTVLRADNASYFDQAKLKMRRGTTLTATNTTRGDVRASDDKIAVWDSFTSIEDPVTKAQVEIQSQRVAFDRRTGRLLNTRGASVEGDTGVRQYGIGLMWPIGVHKRTYQSFNVTTKRAWPMVFRGEETVQGVRVYRFQQYVPPTVVESIKGGVPASVLGMKKVRKGFPGYDKKTGNMAVDRTYETTVTVWIDPHSGVPLNQDQKIRSTLRTRDGVDRLTVADLDLKMDGASRRSLADYAKDADFKILLGRTAVPIGGAILGGLLFVLGLVLVATGRRRPAPPAPAGARQIQRADDTAH